MGLKNMKLRHADYYLDPLPTGLKDMFKGLKNT